MLWKIALIITGIIIYVISTFHIISKKADLTFLNPVRNYDKWEQMNWFGVTITTFLLNIIFLPYAILYWLIILIWFLFTVGRKSE